MIKEVILCSVELGFDFLEALAFHERLCRKEDGNIRGREDELIESDSSKDLQIRILNSDISFQDPIPKISPCSKQIVYR